MKKIILAAVLIFSAGAFVTTTTTSCTTLATSDLGLAVIKRVLTGGVNKASGIFSNKQAFLQNDLILKALPDNLRSVYNTLDRIAPNLTTKGKEYVAETAAYTVNISTPILNNAINNLNTNDVTRIMQGGDGIATQILREKTEIQLVQAIMPKVDEKLNEFGIVRTINTALQGNSLLGSLLGNQSSTGAASNSLSKLASEQMVNGIFYIMADYENQNRSSILGAFNRSGQ
ncbi:DUF4197 family protein [Chryseobacterium sp. MFBS3-17]|uniref:DUF4197 family protein n=1 Tax=Chryseobacterium sp. MFBS3-17 TaxID=2886689 RepID=UPI001D0DD0F9|nr:DUF4197 family protein [Chryseobacterium sp. MFBS3-17]MCC2590117.1 DUF4197 domain-containing protein [Chryseobacterium sp. MFBS3-17]